MTTEIAIVNKNGIALAADSAVSIGSSGNTHKIYNTANKLFMLSKKHPVAIMVYGSGDLVGVPWEPLIKQYRKELDGAFFDTLGQYADHFWGYVQSHGVFFPEPTQFEYLNRRIHLELVSIRERLLEDVEAALSECDDSSVAEEQLPEILNTNLLLLLSLKQVDLKDIEFVDGFNIDDVGVFCDKYRAIILDSAKVVFENAFEVVEDHVLEELVLTIATIFCKQEFRAYSGVVFAGYGDKEIYPQVKTFKVDIFVNDKLRKVVDHGSSCPTDGEVFVPTIIPFAQSNEILTFLQGIDPALNSMLSEVFTNVGKGFSEVIPSELLSENGTEEDIRRELKDLFDQNMNRIWGGVREESAKLVLKPVLEMLEFMPKDELAEMAETLVNLTAFKRRMSPTPESVGGPIDVAILSKGDGFIWVKRKHYFRAELNQHFFANYYE